MKRSITILATAILALVVAANAYVSQKYPRVFYDLVYYKDKSAAFAILNSLRGTKAYAKQLPLLNNLVKYDLAVCFTERDPELKARISRLMDALEKNPNNPQILAAIAMEYKKGAQNEAAKEYYNRAKMIDPFIYLEELEK